MKRRRRNLCGSMNDLVDSMANATYTFDFKLFVETRRQRVGAAPREY